ncbi:MAG: GNAT family N-acetyltransferase [Gammaproteobacteria bacterium]
MTYKIVYEDNHSAEDTQILYSGLATHAKKMVAMQPIETFSYLIRDENNKLLGGCIGAICYGSLHIDTLWIAEQIRGQGYGMQLMQLALEHGLTHACTFATVNTMSWEALDFYKKLGFQVEFKRSGFQKNAVFYFLRKNY